MNQVRPKPSLNFPSCLADGDMPSPPVGQPVPFLIQKDKRGQGQKPEPLDGGGRQHLIVIQPKFFFDIRKKDLNGPACGDVLYQSRDVCVQVT